MKVAGCHRKLHAEAVARGDSEESCMTFDAYRKTSMKVMDGPLQ